MALDIVNNDDIFNEIKRINPDWVNFIGLDDLKWCKRGVVQLYSLGTQFERPSPVSVQVSELLGRLEGELGEECLLRRDSECKVHLYSVRLGFIIRSHVIPSFFSNEQEFIPHIKDACRVVLEYYIK